MQVSVLRKMLWWWQIRNIDAITLGEYEIDTWYFSPYPEEITRGCTRLHICEYTLKPIASPVSSEQCPTGLIREQRDLSWFVDYS